MQFEWDVTPEQAFDGLMRDWQKRLMDRLYLLCEQEAENCQRWMRENAPWQDDCMPGREYLIAKAYRDDDRLLVGIVAYYDEQLYLSKCEQQPFPFGLAHELFTFPSAGVISIIVPRRSPTVLGEWAETFWQRVKRLIEQT